MTLARITMTIILPFAVAINSPAAAQSEHHKGYDIQEPQAPKYPKDQVFGCDTGPFEWILTESILRKDCGPTEQIKVFEDCDALGAYKNALERDIRRLENNGYDNSGLSSEEIQQGLKNLKNIHRQMLQVWRRVISDPNNAYGCPGMV